MSLAQSSNGSAPGRAAGGSNGADPSGPGPFSVGASNTAISPGTSAAAASASGESPPGMQSEGPPLSAWVVLVVPSVVSPFVAVESGAEVVGSGVPVDVDVSRLPPVVASDSEADSAVVAVVVDGRRRAWRTAA